MELHTMDMFFKCKVEDCDAITADDDVAELRWVDIEKLNHEDFGLQSISQSIRRFKELYKNNML